MDLLRGSIACVLASWRMNSILCQLKSQNAPVALRTGVGV